VWSRGVKGGGVLKGGRKTILLDVDDTLINTDGRKHAVWNGAIGLEIPRFEVESLSSREIAQRYRIEEGLRVKFWRIMLCLDDVGERFLTFDEPIPNAVDVVREWSEHFDLMYITGRTENMRKLTVEELRKFGFPVDEDGIYMCSDLQTFLTSPLEVRKRIAEKITSERCVICVVDDYPKYFPVYAELIPLRIGLLRPKRHKPKDYDEASLVVGGWKQLSSLRINKMGF